MSGPENTLRSVAETTLTLSIGDGSVASNTLKVYRVTGHEAISKPFRYAIDLVHVDDAGVRVPLFAGQVLGNNATLEIKVTDGAAMIRRVRDGFIDSTRVMLVPRLAMLHAGSAEPLVVRHAAFDPYGRVMLDDGRIDIDACAALMLAGDASISGLCERHGGTCASAGDTARIETSARQDDGDGG